MVFRNIFFVLCLVFQINANSQNDFTIVYKFGQLPVDTSKNISSPLLHLVIRDTVSFCYYPDSSINYRTPLGISYIPKSAYYNIKTRKSATYLDAKRVYEMDEPEDKYVISGEKKVICGYECVKARITMGKYKIAVWFTSDIPAGFGPFYIHGLPGSVLASLNENSGNYYYAIDVKAEALEIVKPKGKKAPKILTELR